MGISLRDLYIAIFAIALVAGCGQTADPQTLLTQAKEARAKGDNKSAFVLLNNALQSDPGVAEARYLLAVVENEAGDYASAEKEFRKALELGFDSAKVMGPLAWTIFMQAQYQKVLDETKSAPDSAEILSVRGRAQLRLGQLPAAANSFNQALRLEPQFGPALLGQARLAMAERKLDRATQLVNSVLARTPKDFEAWLVAGDLHHMQTNNDKAAESYSQALQIKPEDFTAHMQRATALTDAGKFDAAQADLDAARKIVPNHPIVNYGQAMLFFRRGKPEPALQAIQKVLSVAPDHMPSLLLAGLLNYSLNSLAQAEKQTKQFLDRNPNNLYARKLLASILLKSNQGRRALETLQPVLKPAQSDADVLALAGEAYMQLKQFSEAIDYLRRAVALAPTDSGLHTRLGITSLALGETDRAIVELESATKLDRGLTQADTLLVKTYLRKKDYGKALEAALALQKKQPENPITYDLLGGVYLEKNDLANARKSFERALSLKPDYMAATTKLARLDLDAKDADGARKRFKTVLERDDNNVQAMIGMASVERATGNSSEYASWLERARSADSTALEPRLLLVRHYLQAKDISRARAVATEAKTIQPQNPDVLSLLGVAQSASNDKAGALTTYASLVTLVPQSPVAHYRLATAYMDNQNYVAAADALRKALKLKADYLDAMGLLALLEYRAARYDESLNLAQQIQRYAPKLRAGYTLEGDSLMALRRFVPAEKAYEKAFAIRKSSDLAIKLHAASSQAGKMREANSRLLQWLREHPDDTGPRFFLADGYVKTHENQLAIQQYQLILQKDPKNVTAANKLASLKQQNK